MHVYLRALIMALLGILLLAPGVFAAKLICISQEQLRGQETVNNCLIKGEKFAIVEPDGSVRILSKEEIGLMRKLNPKAFEQPAYGIVYLQEAPEIPKLPPLAVPKQAQ
uniref:Succinylglutamate desuccinylase n=1 Tax=Desulfobacca acetoxidans TaxID=60893 RepID=A0A7C3ZA15_9BACT